MGIYYRRRKEKRRRITQYPAPAAAAAAAPVPDDLLVSEILTRLPVKTLTRCKSVCRSWRAALEDPSFVRRHLELSRTRTPPSALVIPHDGGNFLSRYISFHRLRSPEHTATDAAAAAATAELMLEATCPEEIGCGFVPSRATRRPGSSCSCRSAPMPGSPSASGRPRRSATTRGATGTSSAGTST
ncbi:putative F-box protein At1g33530 [Oryza glaberrima]|uniref:putative F-box protein At1g33530 n=1 Tax=Oryza glaberrima TaxID=4538 RepID=UPI00224BE6D5|nr:putative F-box protein At1g33530 [Oryza glaberrima]